MTSKIPVTVITGFLGSGKTTLLSYILNDTTHKKRIAVIENEFGSQLGVHNEVKGADHAACVAEIYETQNGCICCSGKGDLMKILHALMRQKDTFDYVLIETTGMADPAFVSSFFTATEIHEAYELDGIVTLVDAKNALRRLPQEIDLNNKSKWEGDLQVINESLEQISVADTIMINKTDLVSPEELTKIEAKVKEINPYADIVTTKYSKIDLDKVLGSRKFNIERVLSRDPQFLNFRPFRVHDSTISALSFVCETPLKIPNVEKFLESLMEHSKTEAGDFHLLRTKGVLNVESNTQRYIYQGVYDHFEVQPHLAWETDEPKISKFVFIGKELDIKQITSKFETFNEGATLRLQRMDNRENAPSGWKFLVIIMAWIYFMYPHKVTEMWQTIQSNNLYYSIFMLLFLIMSISVVFKIRGKKKKTA